MVSENCYIHSESRIISSGRGMPKDLEFPRNSEPYLPIGAQVLPTQ